MIDKIIKVIKKAKFKDSYGYQVTDGWNWMLCPYCGHDYIHIGDILIVQKDFCTLVSRGKTSTKVDDSFYEDSTTGSIIFTFLSCECCNPEIGQHFIRKEEFHDGNIRISFAKVKTQIPTELWRD